MATDIGPWTHVRDHEDESWPWRSSGGTIDAVEQLTRYLRASAEPGMWRCRGCGRQLIKPAGARVAESRGSLRGDRLSLRRGEREPDLTLCAGRQPRSIPARASRLMRSAVYPPLRAREEL